MTAYRCSPKKDAAGVSANVIQSLIDLDVGSVAVANAKDSGISGSLDLSR